MKDENVNTPKKNNSEGVCPICGQPTQEKYRPFCSLRCADVDLGRWFKGGYATPIVDNTPEEDEDSK